MSAPDPDYDDLVEALRSPTCSDEHQRQMERRIFVHGVMAAGSAGAVLSAAGKARAALGFAGQLAKSLGTTKLLLGGAVLVVSAAVVAPRLAYEPSEVRAVPSSAHPSAARGDVPVRSVAPLPVVVDARAVEAPSDAGTPPPRARRRRRPQVASAGHLARENALLLEASQKLHAADVRGASRLLDQYDREFPHGLLRKERDVARQRLDGFVPERR
jgi:hypothetical protein